MDPALFLPLAVALGLGLLVGMQREWKSSELAGIRTFPLVTMLGTLCGMISPSYSGLLIGAGLIAVAAMLVVGNIAKIRGGENDPGLTTEMAALVMFCVGAALSQGFTGPAVAVGGAVAVLLHWKDELHRFVRKIGEQDFKAIIHLVLVALVILPLLPNKNMGPFGVLNPYKIWWIVVLIVSISLAAYVVYKLVGARTGALVGGVLGGLISSTATTVSYARQTKNNSAAAPLAALVIVIASTLVNVRMLFEVGIVAPQLLPAVAGPILAMMLLMTLLSAAAFVVVKREDAAPDMNYNPAQLKTALFFAAVYALVLVIVAAVKNFYGTQALYGVAVISGLTNVDAMTLSTAELFKREEIEAATAWRLILLASLANMVFKGGAASLLGSRRLVLCLLAPFAATLIGGALLLAFWPDWQLDLLPWFELANGAANAST